MCELIDESDILDKIAANATHDFHHVISMEGEGTRFVSKPAITHPFSALSFRQALKRE